MQPRKSASIQLIPSAQYRLISESFVVSREAYGRVDVPVSLGSIAAPVFSLIAPRFKLRIRTAASLICTSSSPVLTETTLSEHAAQNTVESGEGGMRLTSSRWPRAP